MSQVISCSRRTDIPACYYEWLQSVLKAQTVPVTNPYSKAVTKVSLAPADVHSIVLWSKDFDKVAEDPGYLKEYNLYFQATITGLGASTFEPNVPGPTDVVAQLVKLARDYSPKQIMWRYDPLFLPSGVTKEQAEEECVVAFTNIAELLIDAGIADCTISTLSLYPKVTERFRRRNIGIHPWTEEDQIRLVGHLAEAAAELNVQLYSCASPILAAVPTVLPGKCVDGGRLTELFGPGISTVKDKGQRPACGCTPSVDIGSYDQACKNNCAYCYANPSRD